MIWGSGDAIQLSVVRAKQTSKRNVEIVVKIANESNTDFLLPGLPEYPYGVHFYHKTKGSLTKVELRMNRIKALQAGFPSQSRRALPPNSFILLTYKVGPDEFMSNVIPTHVKFNWSEIIEYPDRPASIFSLESKLVPIKIGSRREKSYK